MSPSSRAKPSGRAGRFRGMFLWGALLAALLPFSVDCGSGDDNDNGAGPGTDVCSTVYQGKCGVPCSGPQQACEQGLFCSNGQCTAQCTTETGCGDGQVCTTQGRCVAQNAGSGGSGGGLPPPSGSGGSGGSGGSSGAGGAGGQCSGVTANFQPIIPAVMLVADRSASMRCPITSKAEIVTQCGNPSTAGPDSRWVTFRNSLLPFIEKKQTDVIFGVTFYPQNNDCGISAKSAVTLRVDGFDEIDDAYTDTEPGGNTPTGPAIASAVNQINAVTNLPPNTPKFIVLASDGSPTCGDNAQGLAVDAAGDAFDAGIRTFVIAIGELFTANGEVRDRLQALADAGAGRGKPNGSTGPGPLYPVNDTTTLETALTAIIDSTRPCTFNLDKALNNPAVDGPRGMVSIDGQPVTFNDPNGWKLVGNDAIEFSGTACTKIRSPGERDVKASFPCDVQTSEPPPRPPPPR